MNFDRFIKRFWQLFIALFCVLVFFGLIQKYINENKNTVFEKSIIINTLEE